MQLDYIYIILDNDLDGDALSAPLEQGTESLKEILPSLSKRLKLLGALKSLKKFLSNVDDQQFSDTMILYSMSSIYDHTLSYYRKLLRVLQVLN